MLQWFQPMVPRPTVNKFKGSKSVVGIVGLLVICNLKMFTNGALDMRACPLCHLLLYHRQQLPSSAVQKLEIQKKYKELCI